MIEASRDRTVAGILVDLVAIAFLSALALLGFSRSFEGPDYLVVGGIATVAAVFIAVLVASSGHGAGVFLLAAVPAYLLLGGWVVVRSFDMLGLPNKDALLEVMVGTIVGANQILTTIPPVDATAATLMVPWALGFVASGTAAMFALRTRRPLLPATPFLVVVVAVILLGLDDIKGIAVRAAAIAVIVLVWSSDRAGRSEESAGTGTARVGRSLGRLLLAAGLGVAVVVAGPGAFTAGERTTLRGHVGQPADVSRLDNPLEHFRRYTNQPDEPGNLYKQVLLRLKGQPKGTRIRFATLDVYDGTAWRPSNRTVPDSTQDMYQRVASTITAPLKGRDFEVSVTLTRAFVSDWLPTVSQLTSVRFDFLDGRAQREHVRFNPEAQSAFVVGGITKGDDYTITTTIAPDPLGRSMKPYPQVGPNYDAAAFLSKPLRSWTGSKMTPMQKLYSFGTYLRRYGFYTRGNTPGVTVPIGHDQMSLTKGLLGARQMVGTDEQYAAVVALAANRFGVPARVVVGAVPVSGAVRGRDVAAWVEVRTADGRWRLFPSARFLPSRPPAAVAQRRPDPSEFVQQETEPERPAEEPSQETDPTIEGDQPQIAQTGKGRRPVPAHRTPWLWLLLALGGSVVPAAKAVRTQVRRSTGTPAARSAAAWQQLLDTAGDLGHPVPRRVPRPSQATVLGRAGGLAVLVDEAAFGPEEPAAAAVEEVWSTAAAEVAQLRREAPWWVRVRAFYDPRTLIGRRRGASPARPVTRSGRPRRWRSRG